MIGRLLELLVPLLDHLPHDTIHVGGEPYMQRWYLFGYAPTDDPDERMVCATCGAELGRYNVPGEESAIWHHRLPNGRWGNDLAAGCTAIAVSAERPGWWWRDHGLGAVRLFVNQKRATDLHCLIVERGPVWTLFLTRPKVRSWGFAGPFGWVGWREFSRPDADFVEPGW